MRIKHSLVVLLAIIANNLSPAVAATEGSLRVGAARVDQTGPLGASQSGKYDHEHVYARAIVLDNGATRLALVGYEGPEADFHMGATLKRVAEILKVPAENVLITHTHTHSSYSTPFRVSGQGPQSAPLPAEASKEIVAAVTQALQKLQPAKMSFGTGASYLNVNRDAIDPDTRKWHQGTNTDADSDKTVAVLAFLKPSGEPIAVYVTYAIHPINGFVLRIVSGDVPGAMSRYVERAFGDEAVVAFSQSASGDQNPLYLRLSNNAMASRAGNAISGFVINREASEGPLRVADMKLDSKTSVDKVKSDADPAAIDNLLRFVESEGQLLGEEVIRVMTLSRKHGIDQVRLAGLKQTVTCPGRARVNGDSFDPNTREGQAGSYVDAAPINLQVGMLGIGTVAVTSVNAEIYTAIGRRIKESAPMRNTLIATLANERVRGYVLDDASFGHQTFQALDSRLKPGCAETGLTDAVVALQLRYLDAR